jgi:hypothetical protein
MGMILQELWKEFMTNDKDGWINIEELEFDVREQAPFLFSDHDLILCIWTELGLTKLLFLNEQFYF